MSAADGAPLAVETGAGVVIESFPAIAARHSHTLILGTMPGVESLRRQQYYAHPRNAFWPIMTELLALDPGADYAMRTGALAAAGFAVWDVLKACIRPGSLDAAIDATSIVPNDIAAFAADHPSLRRIACNGGKSAQLFRRHIEPQLERAGRHVEFIALPSTSPAHAGMPFAEKLRIWRAALSN
jgi:hypoxanthine-DNA glycosylase